MSVAASAMAQTNRSSNTDWRVIGFALIVLAVVLAVFKHNLPASLLRPADVLVMPFADWINALFNFVKDDLGFIHVTRAFAGGVEWMLDVTAITVHGMGPIFGQRFLPYIKLAVTSSIHSTPPANARVT